MQRRVVARFSSRRRAAATIRNGRVITYNDDGTIIDDIVLNPSEGRYGVNVGKNVWHTVEALEPGSVIFECKEGLYVPHEEEGILEVDN